MAFSANGPWSLHSIELALWTHFVASELKPELLDDIPCANGSSVVKISHQNGDVSSTASKSSEVSILANPSPSVERVFTVVYFSPFTERRQRENFGQS